MSREPVTLNAVIPAQEMPSPLPTPPVIFDLIVVVGFAWAGWSMWRRGSRMRPLAILMWLIACGGLFSLASAIFS